MIEEILIKMETTWQGLWLALLMNWRGALFELHLSSVGKMIGVESLDVFSPFGIFAGHWIDQPKTKKVRVLCFVLFWRLCCSLFTKMSNESMWTTKFWEVVGVVTNFKLFVSYSSFGYRLTSFYLLPRPCKVVHINCSRHKIFHGSLFNMLSIKNK